MNRYIETDLKEVKEQLAWNIQHGHQTILLLGSGVSVSAGIPASEGIISTIRENFSAVCARMHPVTYEDHLAVLTPTQRHELIKGYAAQAKLNASHLYVAALVKAGYSDKILTTNFDTLLHRALALENIYPNIFDFTVSASPDSASFSNVSLYHMHGQKDGMLYLRDEAAHDAYLDKMEKFFQGEFESKTVIILGYSGSDDPLFSYLASIKSFANRLYWVGHGDKEPEEHVFRSLLQKTSKQVCYIKGYDADSFFSGLNRELGIPEPRILENPMSLVDEVMGKIAPPAAAPLKPLVNSDSLIADELEVTSLVPASPSVSKTPEHRSREMKKDLLSEGVNKKIETDELVKLAKDTWSGNLQKNYGQLRELIEASDNAEARKYFSLFLFNWGTEFEKEADRQSGNEAEALYKNAFEKYEEAVRITPDLKEAYNQWGVCLRDLAKTKEGPAAEQLYAEAFKKFEEAVLLNPDNSEPLNNWAIGLTHLAATKNEVEAEKLYSQAFEKYQDALKTKSDLHEVYNNWGVCLKNLASLKREEEAEKLYHEADEKFRQALELKPDYTLASINWGNSLRYQAKGKSSTEAIALHEEAIEKYKNALRHHPDSAEAFNNWGIELGLIARYKGIKEAAQLLIESFGKYEEGIISDPSNYHAYNNWAIDIWNYANLKDGRESVMLYVESIEKFDLALKYQPNSAEIFTNKAICLYKISELDTYPDRQSRFKEAIDCFNKASVLKPHLFECYYQCGIAYRNQAEKYPSDKTDELYILSLKQFEKAMKNKPEKYKLNLQWDKSLTNLAEFLYEDEPEKLYQETFKKYQETIYTERSSLELYNSYDINLTKMGKTPPEQEYEKMLAEALGE